MSWKQRVRAVYPITGASLGTPNFGSVAGLGAVPPLTSRLFDSLPTGFIPLMYIGHPEYFLLD